MFRYPPLISFSPNVNEQKSNNIPMVDAILMVDPQLVIRWIRTYAHRLDKDDPQNKKVDEILDDMTEAKK